MTREFNLHNLDVNYMPACDRLFAGELFHGFIRCRDVHVGDGLKLFRKKGDIIESKLCRVVCVTTFIVRERAMTFLGTVSRLDPPNVAKVVTYEPYPWDEPLWARWACLSGIVPETGLGIRKFFQDSYGRDWEGRYQFTQWENWE